MNDYPRFGKCLDPVFPNLRYLEQQMLGFSIHNKHCAYSHELPDTDS